jgi:hypothetical protein
VVNGREGASNLLARVIEQVSHVGITLTPEDDFDGGGGVLEPALSGAEGIDGTPEKLPQSWSVGLIKDFTKGPWTEQNLARANLEEEGGGPGGALRIVSGVAFSQELASAGVYILPESASNAEDFVSRDPGSLAGSFATEPPAKLRSETGGVPCPGEQQAKAGAHTLRDVTDEGVAKIGPFGDDQN